MRQKLNGDSKDLMRANLSKMAYDSPIFKKGHRTNRANFRPISLTQIVSKILESLVRDELLQYLINENLITKEQHGFIPRRSCTSNLLETLDFVTDALAEGMVVNEILLDFAKAFGLVPHQNSRTRLLLMESRRN